MTKTTCTHITFEAYASSVDAGWALPLRGENQPKLGGATD